MKKSFYTTFITMTLSVLFLYACGGGGTKLTSVNGPKSFIKEPFEKVMILALAKKPENQKIFEEAFASALDASGTDAVAASAILPSDTKPTSEILVQAAQKNGIDAVLITHLVRIGQRMEDVPVSSVGTYGVVYDNSFNHYYSRAYVYVNESPYPDQQLKETFVRLKTVLYEVENQSERWSASSESVDPKTVDQLVRPEERSLSEQRDRLIQALNSVI